VERAGSLALAPRAGGRTCPAPRLIVKAMEVPVNVGYNAKFPNTILLSRGVLSNRGRHSR
jgi:hypothetical protein